MSGYCPGTPHLKCPFIVTRYTTVFPPVGEKEPGTAEASAFCWIVTTADIHDGTAPPFSLASWSALALGRGRGRGGQERGRLVGALPGGVAGQPVAGAGNQHEAGVGDAGRRSAHVVGWDEPVVPTGQQQHRAADGA